MSADEAVAAGSATEAMENDEVEAESKSAQRPSGGVGLPGMAGPAGSDLAAKMKAIALAAQKSRGMGGTGPGLAAVTGVLQPADLVAPYQPHVKKTGGAVKKGPKDASGMRVVASGCDIASMATHINEETVQWALARLTLGSGTFERKKMVLLHVNGEKCSGLKKAKLNAHGEKVVALLGQTNAKVVVEEASEVTLDNILEQTKGVLCGDDLGEYSMADMKKDYENMLQQSQKVALEALISGEDAPKRKTAKALGIGADEALKLVRTPMGAFNWALFLPAAKGEKLTLWDAGSLSVPEMCQALKEAQTEVVAGLIRMGFGAGQWKRTKWLGIVWVGPDVKAVQRGQLMNLAKEGVLQAVKPWSLAIEGTTEEDVALETIIDKVRRSAVVDGEDVDGIGGARDITGSNPFSMEGYLAGLTEEVEAAASFFGEESAAGGTTSKVSATVDKIRAKDGVLTWGLFEWDS
eukprot:m.238046 g.238046  ORF g.238046 m.238046 type:complete len:465 (-) comp18964_c0_seq2:57-1451(-)